MLLWKSVRAEMLKGFTRKQELERLKVICTVWTAHYSMEKKNLGFFLSRSFILECLFRLHRYRFSVWAPRCSWADSEDGRAHGEWVHPASGGHAKGAGKNNLHVPFPHPVCTSSFIFWVPHDQKSKVRVFVRYLNMDTFLTEGQNRSREWYCILCMLS